MTDTATRERETRRDAFLFAAGYWVLWLMLTGAKGWLAGAIVAALAAALSIRLGFSFSVFRPRHIPGFLLFYLKELLVAGWQVALYACRFRMRVAPGWVVMDLKCRADHTQMLLATFVCLLPGTLTSRVDHDKMHIHLLNEKQPWRPTVEKLETRLMALAGEDDK